MLVVLPPELSWGHKAYINRGVYQLSQYISNAYFPQLPDKNANHSVFFRALRHHAVFGQISDSARDMAGWSFSLTQLVTRDLCQKRRNPDGCGALSCAAES